MEDGWEVAGAEEGKVGEDGGAFDGVFEFADIAGPGMGAEGVEGALGDAAGLTGAGMDFVAEEMGDEHGDVVLAFAEGGHGDGDDVEAVEEIFAEAAVADELVEVFVGGGEDADVDVDGEVVADAADFLFLEDAEQAALELGGHGPDFVEEQGAAVGVMEETVLVGDRAGEGALAMAEEFGFEEVFGEGGAIDGDEGGVVAAGIVVEGAGDEFLAGAAFAEDEDGGFGIGDAFDHAEDVLHALAGADDLGEAVFLAEFATEEGIFLDGLGVGEGALNGEAEFVELEGFLEVIVGAELHGLDSAFDGAEAGDHDDDGRGREGTGLADDFEAVGTGLVEVEIGDDEIRLMFDEGVGDTVGIGEGEDLVTFAAEDFGDHLHHGQLVIDENDLGHGAHAIGAGLGGRWIIGKCGGAAHAGSAGSIPHDGGCFWGGFHAKAPRTRRKKGGQAGGHGRSRRRLCWNLAKLDGY